MGQPAYAEREFGADWSSAPPQASAITSGRAGSLTRPGTHAALSGRSRRRTICALSSS